MKKNKVKLSNKQKEVVLLMRDGQELSITEIGGKKLYSQVPYNLKKLGMVKNKEDSLFQFELTDLGKTITL